MRYWIKTTLFAFVFAVLFGELLAQAPAESQGILPLALKVQAYSPLSNLALPFVDRKENLPFSPRFYVVEVEKYFRGGHGVQVSFGGRRYKERGLFPEIAYDTASGVKGRISYQRYLQHEKKQHFEGWFITTGIAWVKGTRHWFDGTDRYGGGSTQAFSLDASLGWGFLFKEHVLVQFSAGPSIGHQNEIVVEGVKGDQVSNFDRFGWRFGEQTDGENKAFWGLSANLSWSIGWVFAR